MKLLVLRYLIIAFLLICSIIHAQTNLVGNDNGRLQYGIAGKLKIEIQSKSYALNFKLSIAAGIGYSIEEHVMPALHTGIIILNPGAIGSSLNESPCKLRSHLYASGIVTTKLDTRNYSLSERFVPFYHFADFTANPLQNPYKTSVSLGTIWARIPEQANQWIGFFNFNAAGRIQFSYYNDGGPVLRELADKLDRYYTGGILLSYHGDEKTALDLIEISYHKFTGYQEHAFDVGEKLQIDYLIYQDPKQFTFNHQRWKIHLADLSSGFSGNFSLYDINGIDLQDAIHLSTNVPYHPDYFTEWRWALGGGYEYNYTEFSP